MKIGVLAESTADEDVVRLLLRAIQGANHERPNRQALRATGWPMLKDVLPAVLRELHYHSDADALVISADVDDTNLHVETHSPDTNGCRHCELSALIAKTTLRPVPGKPAVKIAIALAVPTLEAWLRCGTDPHATEAAWSQGQHRRSEGD